MKNIVVAGSRLQYQESGDGHPLLFIHGAFSSGNTWRKVIPELSEHFRCIVPEWPFGGHKVPMSEDFDFTATGIADLILGVLNALNLTEVTVVSNDPGGAYAQVFAAKYGDKISRLILTNCEGFEIFPPKKFESLKYLVKVPGYLYLMSKIFKVKPMLKLEMTFGLLSHTLTSDEIYQFYLKPFSENSPIRRDFRELASEWNERYTEEAATVLSSFTKPVLIMWGMDDKKLFPAELGLRLKALFQNATFIEIYNSLTYIQEDKPEEFILGIIKFINEDYESISSE